MARTGLLACPRAGVFLSVLVICGEVCVGVVCVVEVCVVKVCGVVKGEKDEENEACAVKRLRGVGSS